MTHQLTISANFRIGNSLPTIEEQYGDLWALGRSLSTFGIPLDQWFPPADSPEASLMNSAFDEHGPTAAALAMARADKENRADDLRNLGVWNGKEGDGGMVFNTLLKVGRNPSNLIMRSRGVEGLDVYENVVELAKAILRIWPAVLLQVDPDDYGSRRVFADRPAAGWMLYLPIRITPAQVPEAADVIAIIDHEAKVQRGTLIVTTADTFDGGNPQHIGIANQIETRLVDQDLLPRLADFRTRF